METFSFTWLADTMRGSNRMDAAEGSIEAGGRFKEAVKVFHFTLPSPNVNHHFDRETCGEQIGDNF